jgi:hypothetical protein
VEKEADYKYKTYFDERKAFLQGANFAARLIVEMFREQSFRNNLTCHEWASWLEKEIEREE